MEWEICRGWEMCREFRIFTVFQMCRECKTFRGVWLIFRGINRREIFQTKWIFKVNLTQLICNRIYICKVLICQVLICKVLICKALICKALICKVLICKELICQPLICKVLIYKEINKDKDKIYNNKTRSNSKIFKTSCKINN